jgi:vacuolar-type H+-ATPase subunit H
MENDKSLEHLLKIESEAAALVNDAQAEADRRVQESEKKNRAIYEERYKAEAEAKEIALRKEKDKIRRQYQKALDEYRQETAGITSDIPKFISLVDNLLLGDI